MSCLFNSFDPYFKQPFGAVRAGQTVRLSLCIPEELGYVDPHLVLKKEGKFDVPVYYRMNFDGQTPRQNHFSVEVPLNDPGLYLSLIHISEPTRPCGTSRMPSSA